MMECFKSSIHTTIRVLKDIRSSDGYGIAMRNFDEYTEDGDLEGDEILCSVKPYSCMKNNNACCFYYAQCACD